jgi:2-phosphosulfolactate phosphatase
MAGFLSESSHVKRLNRLNIYRDFEFCLKHDEYRVLPKLKNGVLVI